MKKAYPNANGLFDTVYVTDKRVKARTGTPFVQVLYDCSHWLTVSNIGCKQDTIRLYCSLRQMPSENCRQQILYFAGLNDRSVDLQVVAVQKQSHGTGNCGVFALAFTNLRLAGKEPSRVVFNENGMRHHLIECLKQGAITPFPVQAMQVPRRDVVRHLTLPI